MTKQFELEQQIMDCWNVVDDLNLLFGAVCDASPELTTDEIANLLLGLSSLNALKFDKMFRTFEEFLKDWYAQKQSLAEANRKLADAEAKITKLEKKGKKKKKDSVPF